MSPKAARLSVRVVQADKDRWERQARAAGYRGLAEVTPLALDAFFAGGGRLAPQFWGRPVGTMTTAELAPLPARSALSRGWDTPHLVRAVREMQERGEPREQILALLGHDAAVILDELEAGA